MSRIFITREIAEAGPELLRGAGHEVTVWTQGQISTDQLAEQAADADALLCLLSDRIDESLLESCPALRIVANYAVGYDNIDVAAASRLGIAVTNTPDVLTEATAELAWALIFAAARRVVEGDRYVRDGHFDGWGPLLMVGMELRGKTLGILGAGRIGQSVGRRAAAFGLNVLYWARSDKTEFEAVTGARRVQLDELLSKSDVVSVNLPLNDGTRHLLDADALGSMKPGAILINTGRGPVVDEAALVDALEQGPLRAAGLDVYENEPDVHPGLLSRNDVVLLPHIGSATDEARAAMAVMAAENIQAALRGERPPQLVNRDLPETWRGS
jgi:glyoxylate reductase